MDAINSPNKKQLIEQLRATYPKLQFVPAEYFYWHPPSRTVFYVSQALSEPEGLYDLFHELAHGLLDHQAYEYDVSLIQMEAEAWAKAQELLSSFLSFDDGYAQASLATYQSWLEKRSRCPACQHTGVQKNKYTYQCINCRCIWRVNDAKFCELRRHQLA